MGDVKDCIQLAGWVPEYPTYCKRCRRTCRMPMMIPAVIVTHPDTKWGWTMSRRWNIPWYPKDVSYPKNWIPPKNISKISIFSRKTAENHPTIQPSNHPQRQLQVAACLWVGNLRVNLDLVRLEISRRGSAEREESFVSPLAGWITYVYVYVYI